MVCALGSGGPTIDSNASYPESRASTLRGAAAMRDDPQAAENMAAILREQATECRRLASFEKREGRREEFLSLARSYEATASAIISKMAARPQAS